MESGGTRIRSPARTEPPQASFLLERFEWPAPDRLELTGRFSGLDAWPDDEPFLAVRDGGRVQRLVLRHEDRPDAALDGARWWAAFAWAEPPVPFDRVELHMGRDVVFELPWSYRGTPPGTRVDRVRGFPGGGG